jgi:hypothetical protein
MLMPAAVLIVIVLAAITIDLSLVHLARRELVAAAEAAANDAATSGFDEPAFRAGEGFRLDIARVRQSVHQSLVARDLADDLQEPPDVGIVHNRVRVHLILRVDYVFAAALPGVDHSATVSAVGTASPIER